MLKKILGGLAAVLVVLVGVIAMQPSEYTVQRTATLPVPKDIAFALVNDFHRWNDWSPWAKLDPDIKTTFGGAQAGVGATYAWVGNEKVGEGKMTILESKPDELVRLELEFFKPMAGVSETRISFKAVEGGTEVVWAMSGANNFVGKAMCLVMDMDQLIGKDFEEGLANLKTVGQAEAAKRAEAEAARVAEEKAAAEREAAEKAAAASAAGQPAVAQPTP